MVDEINSDTQINIDQNVFEIVISIWVKFSFVGFDQSEFSLGR